MCLVYETLETINPKIYLIEMQTLKWQFLADTFTEYQRMCVVHLGLPYWELCFAETCHLPSWAEQLFLLLAPHLLESSETRRNHRYALSPSEPIVYNQLDPLVFRAKTKSHKQTPKYKWKFEKRRSIAWKNKIKKNAARMYFCFHFYY